MKKRIKFLCILCIAMLSLPMTVCAEETPKATFDGTNELKYNYDDTANFGDGFVNMMPGETRSQEIILENTSNKTVDFYMKTEILKTFEEVKKTSGAAYQVMLTITNPNGTGVIYGGSEEDGSGRIGADDQGLGNLNDSMGDWYMVATLEPTEEAVITLSVSLDGESHTNSYQSAEGTFQFEFKAGYDDRQTVFTIYEQLEDTIIEQIIYSDVVKTGDNAMSSLWMLGIGLCGACLLVLIIIKKSEKGETK